MRTKFLTLLIMVVATMASLSAQQQIATATSTSSFTLRGATVTPGQGVENWPLMPGDTLQAGTAPLTLTFPNLGVVTLEPGAQGRVELQNGRPVFRLTAGRASYTLQTLTSIQLMEMDSVITPGQLTGTLEIPGSPVSGGFFTPTRTAIIFGGAAAAAGAGVGIAAATSGGRSVSPSQPQQP